MATLLEQINDPSLTDDERAALLIKMQREIGIAEENIKITPTILRMHNPNTSEAERALLLREQIINENNGIFNPSTISTSPVAPVITDVGAASFDDLTRVVDSAESVNPDVVQSAIEELDKRARIQNMTFLEQLTSPEALERIARSTARGPSQAINGMVNGLPALALMGLSAATDDPIMDDAAANAIDRLATKDASINDVFGVSEPITQLESLGEAAMGAAIPGGAFTKFVGVGTDFFVDQTVRELTDDEFTNYSTIFDDLGVNESGSIHPLLAIPAGMIAGSLSMAGINMLRSSTTVKPPTIRDIAEIDVAGPENLKTIETSTDVAKATMVDAQTALVDIVERAGVPNIAEIDRRITVDSGPAASIRVREATRTGSLNANGQTYKSDFSVRALYDAYRKLPAEMQKGVSNYINIFDQLDDARIALREGRPGNHQATISILTAQAQSIEQAYPIATQFADKYRLATKAVRDYLEGNVLSQQQRIAWDNDRPNYVPYYEGQIDHGAPLLQRLNQTNNDTEIGLEDTFLHTRKSNGAYDPSTRVNPFEMLHEYTEKTLMFGLRNQTRKLIIDAIQNSTYGRETIRKVTKNDNLEENARRIVEVYRDGVKERYLTSNLVADILTFDPQIAKHPMFYVPKRIAEYAFVGPASRTFAPVSMMRDILAAPVLRPQGISPPNPFEVVAAIPKQLFAKTKKAIAANLEAGLLSEKSIIPEAVWPAQSRRAFADMLSNQYINSIYHQAQSSGGIDASIMRTNVEVAKTAFQEIRRSLDEGTNTGVTRLVKDYGAVPVGNIVNMFVSLYDSVMDASRFAAFEKNIKLSKNVDDVAAGARNLVGDVSRSGRSHLADGRYIRGDTVDQGITANVVNKLVPITNFVTESSPFVNPMIQGTRRLINAFKEDPVGMNMRAWLTIGLPTVAAYSWNEMLGEEYNDYAMDRRAARDIAMKPIYIGLPGKPPEEGIEIDIPHELMLFASPFVRGVHSLTRNENGEEAKFAMHKLLRTISENSVSVGTPVLAQAFASATGLSLPDTLIGQDAMKGGYAIREDESGYFSQNFENMLKDLFGINANTALQFASVMSGDNTENTWSDYLTNIVDETLSATPIIRNVTGRKTANTAFSIPSQYDREKYTAITKMEEYLKLLDPEYQTDAGLQMVRKSKPANPKDTLPEEYEDLPFAHFGPSAINELQNPLVEMFGQLVKAKAKNNNVGMRGLSDRITIYNRMIKNIRGYHRGNREDGEAWAKLVAQIQNNSPDIQDVRVKEIVDQFNIDFDNYQDRVKLINLLENERSFLISAKMEVYQDVEAHVTEELRAIGLLKTDDNFRIDLHLDPNDPKPLGITKDMVAAMNAAP